MQTDLQQRVDNIKTTAIYKAREKMGPIELLNWWTSFRKNISETKRFEDLDKKVQAQILEWEADSYKIIGT